MNLIEHNSIPIKCPFCRQEVRIAYNQLVLFSIIQSYISLQCRVLFLPYYDPRNVNSDLHRSIIRSVTAYNSRAEHRIPVNT